MYKNNYSLIVVSTLISLSIFAVAPTTYAITEPTDRETIRQKMDEKLKERQANFEEKRKLMEEKSMERREELVNKLDERKCVVRQNRIDNKLKMLEVTRRFHREKYDRMYERLVNLVDKLKETHPDNQNVLDLEADLAELKTKVAVVKEKYDALVAKLQDIKGTSCDVEEPNYQESVSEIEGLLEELRTAVKDVKDYFVNTIRPDLQALREELKPERKEKESGESTESAN